jgi:plasmid stabilization system protein ParE
VRVKFLKPAELELDDALEYYESEQVGLGLRFLAEVAHSLSRLVEYPQSYQQIGQYARRCLVHKFPYGVIYQIREKSGEILIIAIAHLHRKPDYCLSRE